MKTDKGATSDSAVGVKNRRRSWRFLYQFSLRSLVILVTLAALGCWWLIQPQGREEDLSGKQLRLWRQVRTRKVIVKRLDPKTRTPKMVEKEELINDGRWQLRDHDYLVVDGRYENDQPHGKWIVYHVNGHKAAEGRMAYGAKDGIWRTWNEDGRLLSEVTHYAK